MKNRVPFTHLALKHGKEEHKKTFMEFKEYIKKTTEKEVFIEMKRRCVLKDLLEMDKASKVQEAMIDTVGEDVVSELEGLNAWIGKLLEEWVSMGKETSRV